MSARTIAFPPIWSEDAPPEVYLLGSGVPAWASGTAQETGETLDGRPVYTVEDEDGRVVGLMTIDGEFTEKTDK
jgi:hypothetical protein